MKIIVTAILLCMTTTVTANDTATVLQYLVREPKVKSAHPPLLILLHGFGSNEADLFSFAKMLPGKYLVVSARAPLALGGNSFAWYPIDFSTGKPVYDFQQEEKSRYTIIKFIGQISKKYSVNQREIYLCGFSQGAIMSYSVALTRPDLVKGIAVMSGRLLEEIKPLIATRQKLQPLKVLISHGVNDNTLGFQYAQTANAYLKTLGLIPVFKQYQAGHEINSAMFTDLVNWLQ